MPNPRTLSNPSRAFRAAQVAILLLLCLAFWRVAGAITGDDKVQPLGGGRYLTTEARTVSANGLDELRISAPSNIGGHIVVNATAIDSVQIEIDKVLRVESKAIAAELDQEIQVRVTTVNGTLKLEIETPRNVRWEDSDWGVSLDMTITVPQGWNLDFNTRYFHFDLEGPFRDVDVSTEYGRVKLKDVDRRVNVRGHYTIVELIDVRGDISASTSYQELTVRGAIPGPDKPVRLSNESGPIEVADLVGAVMIETERAPVVLDRVSLVGGISRVISDDSPIEIDLREFGDARLEIETSHSSVTLYVPEFLSARLNLVVGRNGSIHSEGLKIQTHKDLLGRGRLEGVCGSGLGRIDIEASGSSHVELIGR